MSDNNSYSSGKVTGSCACRRITFETTVLGQNASSCYCRECAKVSGTGYLSFIHFPVSAVKWSTEPDIWKSSDIGERGFCKQCGSSVMMRDEVEPEVYAMVMSMIDHSDEPLPRSDKHIFLEEKAGWVVVPDDGSQRFDKHDPAFQTTFDEWKKAKK